MNILHITTFLQGGAGRIICDLLINQKKSGNNVFIVCSKTEEPGYCNYKEYIEELSRNNICVYYVDSTFKRDLFLNFKAINLVRDLIISNKINIIHAHAAVPALIGRIAKVDESIIPIIQTMHGWGTNKNEMQEYTDISIMNLLDRIVPVSYSAAQLLVSKGINEKKITVIYNAVSQAGILQDDIFVQKMKELHTQGIKLIGCLGTICERKNQGLIVEAFAKLKNLEKLKCIFIGEEHEEYCIREKIQRYGLQASFEFFGYVKNASSLIKYFDYLILPSNSEGLPLTVLEGYREKVPVIGSDIPEIVEIINDSESGILFKANDSESFAEVLNDAIFNQKYDLQKIVDHGYNLFCDKFDMNSMLYNYEKLYNELLCTV